MLLGFSERGIKEKLNDIIAFSELGKFIDYPVRTYSSGMYSKLAFSITVSLKTDIVLIDEILSVGDVRFKNKSYSKMQELINDQNRTVIIVSHSLSSLKSLCSKILWIDNGELKLFGDTKSVLKSYKKYMMQETL